MKSITLLVYGMRNRLKPHCYKIPTLFNVKAAYENEGRKALREYTYLKGSYIVISQRQ